MKPIYTNRSSGMVNKKILKVTNFEPLFRGSTLVLRNVDYFNTAEDSSDEDSSSSESESESDDFDANSISTGETNASSLFDDEPITPKLLQIPPMTTTNATANRTRTRAGSLTCVTNANSQGRRGHVRNASFTSSGNSFGEGIIKYSRSQIRDMLMQMSLKDHDLGNGDDAIIEEGSGGLNDDNGNAKNGKKGAKGKSKSKNKKRKGGKNSRKNSGSSSSSSDGAFASGAGISSNGSGNDTNIVVAPVQLEVPAGFGKRRKSVRFIEDDVVVECAS
ncbi:unnamed protein product [Ambrosiozyma monospora]|uniref:Unnamed protein product n=1 Tax=Ambrosiozyma monospora TaxID=43982 RepID=A0ACB5T5T1_AMBMO|nr:unnamed protein product [Ambrosiozyma monospora]